MATKNHTQENRGQNFKQIEGESWLSAYLPAICAGTVMAIALLLAISCSKKDDKPTAKSNPPSPPMASPMATAPAAVAPQAPKKVKKHRPLNATYVNSEYGLSFSYPRKYTLKSAEDKPFTDSESGFLKPGSTEIVRVNMPNDSYPDTDFSSGLLEVRVDPSVTADECQAFDSKPAASAKPASVKLGSNEFTELSEVNGGGQDESDRKYFHLFKNRACYEFSLDVETSPSDADNLAHVDRGKVFQQLEKILTSARIKSIDLSGQENAEKNAAPKTSGAQPTDKNAPAVSAEQK